MMMLALVVWLALMSAATLGGALVAICSAVHRHHQAAYWRSTWAHITAC